MVGAYSVPLNSQHVANKAPTRTTRVLDAPTRYAHLFHYGRVLALTVLRMTGYGWAVMYKLSRLHCNRIISQISSSCAPHLTHTYVVRSPKRIPMTPSMRNSQSTGIPGSPRGHVDKLADEGINTIRVPVCMHVNLLILFRLRVK